MNPHFNFGSVILWIVTIFPENENIILITPDERVDTAFLQPFFVCNTEFALMHKLG